MIYLGKNASSFEVYRTDVVPYYNIQTDTTDLYEGYSVDYKGFRCIVNRIYTETVSISLVTNNPNDYIPIVV